MYSKTCLKQTIKRPKLGFQDQLLLYEDKGIAECSFDLHYLLPSVFKTFVLFIFEWLLKTGFTAMEHPNNILSNEMGDSIG